MDAQKLKAITYVSLRTRQGQDGEDDLRAILSIAINRNKALGITGALFSTSRTFAQLIEGPADTVDALIEGIRRDSRHSDIKIVSMKYIDRRRFPKWAMAYSGDAAYIDIHIKRLVASSMPIWDAEQVAQLESLMEEFSKRLT